MFVLLEGGERIKGRVRGCGLKFGSSVVYGSMGIGMGWDMMVGVVVASTSSCAFFFFLLSFTLLLVGRFD